MEPRMARARPIVAGERARPPVKWRKERKWWGSMSLLSILGGSVWLEERGVERKMNQRALKVPMWKAKRPWLSKVVRTLGVRMERKGGVIFCVRGLLGFEMGLDDSSS